MFKDVRANVCFLLHFLAYEILSDTEKRRVYDRTGSAGQNTGSRSGNFHFNFDDLFKQFESDIFGADMKGHFANHFSNHFESHFNSHAQHGMDIDIDSFFKVSSKFRNLTDCLAEIFRTTQK